VRLVIVPAALIELQAASDFYISQASRELARAFIDEFDRVTKWWLVRNLVRSGGMGDVVMAFAAFHIALFIRSPLPN
jgi:hypothetical protein